MKLILLRGWSKFTWVLNARRKSPVFSVSMQIDLDFVWVVQIDLSSVWGIELDLIPVYNENDFIQCGGSALVLFLCSCRKQLTSVRIDISWVSVSGHQNRFDTRVGIKID